MLNLGPEYLKIPVFNLNLIFKLKYKAIFAIIF
jgi:hypothetical protein